MCGSLGLIPPKLRSRGTGAPAAGAPARVEWSLTDRTSLPAELHAALLRLLLDNLAHAVSPSNPHSYQTANSPVVRKLFGCVRLPEVPSR